MHEQCHARAGISPLHRTRRRRHTPREILGEDLDVLGNGVVVSLAWPGRCLPPLPVWEVELDRAGISRDRMRYPPAGSDLRVEQPRTDRNEFVRVRTAAPHGGELDSGEHDALASMKRRGGRHSSQSTALSPTSADLAGVPAPIHASTRTGTDAECPRSPVKQTVQQTGGCTAAHGPHAPTVRTFRRALPIDEEQQNEVRVHRDAGHHARDT